ncbi:alpha/beta fold hydrolase [Aestuariibius sp. HNIBRBA575]|uniref:alpha/beta fold hydrolase n=1 Tax=Aestuariibius sp. HNIBRBA575 TaxID=3233343 RepID=UPI0034A486D5
MSEPLVLLAGMMCDARVFLPQIVDLSLDHAVTIIPLTQGERIEEIASAILTAAPAKFALCGHDMGGVVAMELARRAPDRITRLALMNCTPLADTPPVAVMRDEQIIKARAGRLQDALTQDVNAMGLAEGPAKVHVHQGLIEMGMDLGPELYVRQTRVLQKRRDQQATLRQLRMPTLVMCGAEDQVTPIKRHEFVAELIPYARLQVIDGAGHVPQLEAPDATNAALRTWMRQPLVLR